MLHDLEVELHDDIAVTRGTIEFVYTDARTNLYLGFVRVQRLLDSGWRAISHRSFYVVTAPGSIEAGTCINPGSELLRSRRRGLDC